MSNTIQQIKAWFDKPSIEEIAAYQHKMPRRVLIQHSLDEETGFYTASVLKIDDTDLENSFIITESKTVNGLVEMVNDALYTYLDIPERMKASLPKILPEDIDYSDKFATQGELVLAK